MGRDALHTRGTPLARDKRRSQPGLARPNGWPPRAPTRRGSHHNTRPAKTTVHCMRTATWTLEPAGTVAGSVETPRFSHAGPGIALVLVLVLVLVLAGRVGRVRMAGWRLPLP
ncbi:hypothetical protein ACJQWK_06558 [Exserohilum turcicum]|uniref:Uncharacterized protein n=1 Tax=Exserohilum turcicum (strain 28A) TaxID=671987 RepID=R0JVY3_EXST2|nr:uncharacterized protein SETTUDRAFT_163842 [Exserohilum turcica Et28A]EOA85118.1 hypothetical protein SETTUDRAFT_163842 [Exserohilum turcica Et28A]